MSLVYKVFEDLVDDLLDRVKDRVDGYADSMKYDIEIFLEKTVQRAIKMMTVGILGAVLAATGLIFALVGLITFLSQVINPALAWGLVGLGTMGAGGLALFLSLRGKKSREGRPRSSGLHPVTKRQNNEREDSLRHPLPS